MRLAISTTETLTDLKTDLVVANNNNTQTNLPPAFSISRSGLEGPPSVLTPKLSSDFIYPKKGSNWRTVVIKANSITHKRREFQQ